MVRIRKIPMIAALMLAAVEGLALFFIALFGVDVAVEADLFGKFCGGIAVGLISLGVMILAFNYIQEKRMLRQMPISHISIIVPPVMNGMFLGILFVLESMLSFFRMQSIFWGNLLLSLTTPACLFFMLLLYNRMSFAKPFRIWYSSRGNNYSIARFCFTPIIVFAALYEVLFLPSFFLIVNGVQNKLLWYPAVAFAVALVSSWIVILVFNNIILKKAGKLFVAETDGRV